MPKLAEHKPKHSQIPTAPGIGVLVEIDLGLQGSR